MSKWAKVGEFLKENAGEGAALVGSLLTGNVAGAVAAGVSIVSGATGTNDPDRALESLKNNPDAIVELKRIAHEEQKSIRDHLAEMERLRLEDEQKAHETTQKTIQEGDKAEDPFIRRTRPGQSWCSLFAAFGYVFMADPVDVAILGLLLTLPWAYAGLRQVGKGIDSIAGRKK